MRENKVEKLLSITAISLFTCAYLLLAASAYALIPIEEEEESQKIAVTGNQPEDVLNAKAEPSVSPAAEKKFKESIKKIQEEKKDIVENRKPTAESFKRGSFISGIPPEQAEQARYASCEEAERSSPTERHNILLAENPIEIALSLLALSLVSYLFYRIMLKKFGK